MAKAAKRKTTKKIARKSTKKKKSGTKQRTAPAGDDHSTRVDAYIEKSADFAKPILSKLRKLFHQACPAVEEKIKWGVPHFDYKGMLGGMAAFKQHVGFGFWKSELIKDTHKLFDRGPKASMCTVKIANVKDLPPDKVLLSYIKQAVELNDDGTKVEKKKKAPKPPPTVPPDLKSALAKNRKAAATFENFPPSCRREYIEWITEAKRDETRKKRLATAIEWMNEGKSRHWKYKNC